MFKLSPAELLFYNKGELTTVVHDCVNQMVIEDKIHISSDNKLTASDYSEYTNAMEYSILETLKNLGPTNYQVLFDELLLKPVFRNVANAMNAFNKHFIKSIVSTKLHSLNLIVFGPVFMLGLVRVLTEIVMDGMGFLPIILVFSFHVVYWSEYLSKTSLTWAIISSFYEFLIIRRLPKTEMWKWDYFLYGESALAAAFIPLVSQVDQNIWNKAQETFSGV